MYNCDFCKTPSQPKQPRLTVRNSDTGREHLCCARCKPLAQTDSGHPTLSTCSQMLIASEKAQAAVDAAYRSQFLARDKARALYSKPSLEKLGIVVPNTTPTFNPFTPLAPLLNANGGVRPSVVSPPKKPAAKRPAPIKRINATPPIKAKSK